MTIQDDVTALVAAVAAQSTIPASVATLVAQYTALLTTLKGQTVDPATVAALEGAITALQGSSAAIQAAVVAGTPAA